MSDGIYGDAVKVGSGLFGLGGGAVFMRWFITWLTGRHDAREAAIDAKGGAIDERWSKYTKRMEDRCEKLEGVVVKLESEVDDCHRSKRELEARVAKLEGYDHGSGDRRGEEQLLRALEARIAQLEGPKV